jgi:hypothetical protein
VALAQEFNDLRLSERLGPTAVVVRSEATYRQVSDFKVMTAMTRPLQIFDERDAAYAWLTTNPWDLSSPFAEVPEGADLSKASERTRATNHKRKTRGFQSDHVALVGRHFLADNQPAWRRSLTGTMDQSWPSAVPLIA